MHNKIWLLNKRLRNKYENNMHVRLATEQCKTLEILIMHNGVH